MIAEPAPLKLMFFKLLKIPFTLFTIPVIFPAAADTAPLIPRQAFEMTEPKEEPELLNPLKNERILLITPLIDPPTELITALIPFHAKPKMFRKTPPALP